MPSTSSDVFRALADPTRRRLLDRLRERNGQTLGELCADLGMARQSATQHLEILEATNLVSTIRSGRQKLHYLNPVPLWEITHRWITRFEQPRLEALHAIKATAEETRMSTRPSYVYVTYIQASPEQVWDALTSADLSAEYWGHRNVSDWQVGSSWEHTRVDGSGVVDVRGTVLAADPPNRLTITFGQLDDADADDPSRVTFTIEQHRGIVRLTVLHENLVDDNALRAISAGWPAVCANLKSLLETGSVLPDAPWEMHAELRAEQMAASEAN